MKRAIRFRIGDVVVLAILLILASLLTIASTAMPKGGKAVVLVDGKPTSVLPLGTPATITVQGTVGRTTVQVDSGTVRITASACSHEICIRMGAISTRGQVLICVPNHVAVRVEGGEEGVGVDGVTG
jgi:hypothetical protein